MISQQRVKMTLLSIPKGVILSWRPYVLHILNLAAKARRASSVFGILLCSPIWEKPINMERERQGKGVLSIYDVRRVRPIDGSRNVEKDKMFRQTK